MPDSQKSQSDHLLRYPVNTVSSRRDALSVPSLPSTRLRAIPDSPSFALLTQLEMHMGPANRLEMRNEIPVQRLAGPLHFGQGCTKIDPVVATIHMGEIT